MAKAAKKEKSGAEGIKWDLSELYSNLKDKKIQRDIKDLFQKSEAFEKKYRGKINSPKLTPKFLLNSVEDLEYISEKIAKLLQFTTTESKTDQQDQNLDEYIGRMKEGQEKIFFLVSESLKAGKSSPHLEIFKKKGIEVILLHDRIDEWLMSHLQEYDGKQFQDISRGELDLGKMEDQDDKEQQEKTEKQFEDLMTRIKDNLGDKVKEVRVTHRLTDSPACLAVDDLDMGLQMRKIMEASGQEVPDTKPIFEVNPEHPLVSKLDKEADEDRFGDVVFILFSQASLAEGGQLDDPADFSRRLNKLLLELG